MLWLEGLSYAVTILGFPIAIFVFIHEERRRLANDENELHRNLSEEYDNYLRLVLDNADLLLLRRSTSPQALTEEQLERREVIFRMLVSLFEKAYIILYNEDMSREAQRRWLSWEDDIRGWCRKEDYRAVLPDLLEGEDDAFSRYIRRIAETEARLAAA